MKDDKVIAGNVYNKYESKNPLVRWIMRGFFNSFDRLIHPLEVNSILEVGCGEGHLTKHIKELKQNVYLEGVDLSPDIIKLASKLYPKIKFRVESVYKLSYDDDQFDLIIMSECLEHLEDPLKAINEIKRVANRYCFFSVPREPIWRILNIARGKYLKDFGNTPGHIQHWNKKDFTELMGKQFLLKKILAPFPWTMALCEMNKGNDGK